MVDIEIMRARAASCLLYQNDRQDPNNRYSQIVFGRCWIVGDEILLTEDARDRTLRQYEVLKKWPKNYEQINYSDVYKAFIANLQKNGNKN